MSREYNIGIFWVTVATLVLGLVLAIIAGAQAQGRADARIVALESAHQQSISRGEWDVFTKDLRDRLNRIENKLDSHTSERR